MGLEMHFPLSTCDLATVWLVRGGIKLGIHFKENTCVFLVQNQPSGMIENNSLNINSTRLGLSDQ